MTIYNFEAELIQGRTIRLSEYRGKVLMIVNVASQCSFSRQFAGLQSLYNAWRKHGFEILAFPCNQFNGKEPGNHAEVEQACRGGFGVTFPLFEKIEVRGERAHPLFAYLTEQAPFQGFDPNNEQELWMKNFLLASYPEIYEGNGIKWNFTKFLINRHGKVTARFEPTTEPEALGPAIETLLGQ